MNEIRLFSHNFYSQHYAAVIFFSVLHSCNFPNLKPVCQIMSEKWCSHTGTPQFMRQFYSKKEVTEYEITQVKYNFPIREN
jgi:hypothetical protein